MAEHKLKCWPAYFDALQRGDKNFEVRRDDRGFQRGDVLVLEKYSPTEHRYEFAGYGYGAQKITLRRRISYILTGGQLGVEPGYVVMALEPIDEAEVTPFDRSSDAD